MRPFFCANNSSRNQEPIAGTAPRCNFWLLINYSKKWNAQIKDDNELPNTTNEALQYFCSQYGGRCLFIKKASMAEGEIVLCYSSDIEPRILPVRDVLARDLTKELVDALISRLLKSGISNPSFSSCLFAVCTHGKHDKCCAKFGFPVFRKFEEIGAPNICEISHIGGDRFAANMVLFPYGIYFGRLSDGNCLSFLTELKRGSLLHSHFRGRACLSAFGQIAEAFLLENNEANANSSGYPGIFVLEESSIDAPSKKNVSIFDRTNQKLRTIQVERLQGVRTVGNCRVSSNVRENMYRCREMAVAEVNYRMPAELGQGLFWREMQAAEFLLIQERSRNYDGIYSIYNYPERTPPQACWFISNILGAKTRREYTVFNAHGIAGRLNLRNIRIEDSKKIGMMGINLFQEFTSQGLGGHVVSRFTRFCLEVLGCDQVEIEVIAYNDRAIRTYSKAGYVVSGNYWSKSPQQVTSLAVGKLSRFFKTDDEAVLRVRKLIMKYPSQI